MKMVRRAGMPRDRNSIATIEIIEVSVSGARDCLSLAYVS